MSTPSLTTLFEESCDPHSYIPRRASEEVLRCLSALIRDGEPVVVLHGPSGIGKTMLLRVLAERFEDERRVAYVSLSEAPAPELTHRVLDALAEPAADDPARALIRAASAASEGQPRLLLLVDHANLAPIASSLQLADAAQKASPHLTIVFAVADEQGAEEFARALSAAARVATLRFHESMDSKEATAYVRLRLARSEVPAELREQLDDRAMTWLSEGARAALPREINRRAAELLRSYEEDGEAALQMKIDAPAPPSPSEPESATGPRAIDPSDVPRGKQVEPHPPSFPMSPPADAGSGGRGGGGSLGGMLLGHGPGSRANFEIDLELGRSLSSGLLESAATKKPTRDGQPVHPPTAEERADKTDEKAPAAHPSEGTHRGVLWAVASMTTLLMLGGFYLMMSAVEPDPALDAGTDDSARNGDRFARILEPEATEPSLAPPSAPAPRPPSPSAETVADEVVAVTPAATPSTTPATPAALDEATTRPSLVAGPLLDPVVARRAETEERRARDSATEIARLEAAQAPPPRRNARPARPKGPIVLQSGDSAELSHPGSYTRLMIDVEPGSEVFVDGQSIGRAPFDEIFVEMGLHTFVAEMPDGITIEQLVDVEIGTEVVEF